jgi:hypothetical protein
MTRILKTLAVVATLAATLTLAKAGSNECVGYVSAGKIADDDGEWTRPIPAPCTFSMTSKVGKMILAKCPIGSACRVTLPLEASSTPITTTRVQIEKECDGRCVFVYPKENGR